MSENKIYYSATTNGFYTDEVHGDNKPADSQQINETEYKSIILKLTDGSQLASNKKGEPITVDKSPLSTDAIIKNQIIEIENNITARRIREAILGSDNGWLVDKENTIKTLRDKL